jgi:predicted DNA-binding transcriptional regulator AlpA
MNEFTCDAASRAVSISAQVNAPGDNDSESTGDTPAASAVDRTAKDRGPQGAVGSITNNDPSLALSTKVEGPAGTEAPRGMRPKRPVSNGSSVRQSFSHGRSKAVVVEKVKRRFLAPSEWPGFPAGSSATDGCGEKLQKTLSEPAAKSPLRGGATAAAPNLPPSADTGPARDRAGSKMTLRANAIPLHADSLLLLTESAVATRLSLSPATLRNWRVKGLGPSFVRLSRRAVRYEAEVVDEWTATCSRRSTSDRGRENG